jgi:hypothetical protein
MISCTSCAHVAVLFSWIFLAEVHIKPFLDRFDALNSGGILFALDSFAHVGDSSRGINQDIIVAAYYRANLRADTTEIGVAMDRARKLQHTGHWQAFFNSYVNRHSPTPRVVVAPQILQGAEHGSEDSPLTDPSYQASGNNNATARAAENSPSVAFASGGTTVSGPRSVSQGNVASGSSSRRPQREATTLDSLEYSADTENSVAGNATSEASGIADSASIGQNYVATGSSTRGTGDATTFVRLEYSAPSDASGSESSALFEGLENSADTESAATSGLYGLRHV